MKYLIWTGMILLLFLHQDFWFWEDASLVLGCVPVGMAYHIGISFAAAALWWLATKFCWPDVADAAPPTGEGSDRS